MLDASCMLSSSALQPKIEQLGRQIFALVDQESAKGSSLSQADFYSHLMEWSMRDESFKTQMFRFVDVLPTLKSSREVVRHMAEYLRDAHSPVATTLRRALEVGGVVPAVPALMIRRNVKAMANIFIAGTDAKSALPNLQRIWEEQARFTVDILGEAVVSEREADLYAQRYLTLLNLLAESIGSWKVTGPLAATEPPLLNVSVKISALCSRIRATDPEGSIEAISQRLMPIVVRAKELHAFINLDMEHYGLKELTLRLFQRLCLDPSLRSYPHLGIVLQAYLRDSFSDANELVAWARRNQRPITIRLVKGAYWDFEKVIAAQRTWTVPVYTSKPATDSNYERITRLLLENHDAVYAGFASHNIRTIAHALVYSRELGLRPGNYEFQMLYGMAEPIRRALVHLGERVREYCPIGDLVPGMAYLVRRLLENTSNEGFLRARFADHASADKLLQDPVPLAPLGWDEPIAVTHPVNRQPAFVNEPSSDFALDEARSAMAEALIRVRKAFGRRVFPVVNGKRLQSNEAFMSFNPARLFEVVGSVTAAGPTEVALATSAARQAAVAWGQTPWSERARLLDRLAQRMRARRYELAAWEVFEVGKNWVEADADVVEAIDFCLFYAEEARRIGRGRLTQDVPGEVSLESYTPRGVAAIIAPWNFPLAILTGMTTAALVAGNTVVIKPAEQSSVIGSLLFEMLEEAGIPPGVANFLPGTGEAVGSYLVAHPEVDIIAFTGSREVGTNIWEVAAVTQRGQRNLKKVVCEMGGKNAMIIDTDADLDEAVLAIVQSAFGYQGQKCSALSRLITVGDVGDTLLPRLVEATAALQIGLPEIAGTEIGPVIDGPARAKIENYRAIGRQEHEILFEAKVPAELNGYYVPPSIYAGVEPQSRLAQEEIFGPVLACLKARTLDEAIQIGNQSEFALTGGFFSRSPKNIEKVQRQFSVGNLYVNRGITGAIVGRHPFGGFHMSGGGTKAGGRDYLLQFTFPRVVTENTLRRGFAPES
jgi:RHH-type proline utilization regulon transcriptional repressor/proline dehydrogenase/delta 1-pyrroline-5-carboxylate dehydrogenase